MHIGKWLDAIVFGQMPSTEYWHVYRRPHGPLSANPNSQARLALADGVHGMFYVGDTPAAALWEAVLRHSQPSKGRIFAHPADIEGMNLARVRLMTPIPLLDLRHPARRELVAHDSDLDLAWTALLHHPVHANTHAVAAAVHAQLVAEGHALAAFAWRSRMVDGESVYLLYSPPCTESVWTCVGEVALDGPDGDACICAALSSMKPPLAWISRARGAAYDPP